MGLSWCLGKSNQLSRLAACRLPVPFPAGDSYFHLDHLQGLDALVRRMQVDMSLKGLQSDEPSLMHLSLPASLIHLPFASFQVSPHAACNSSLTCRDWTFL